MEEATLQSLKEFINLKFQSMEEKFALKYKHNEEKLDDLERKLERHSERIYKLEQVTSGASKTTWNKITDSLINWAVPFVMMSILFYITGVNK